jgi:NAD(P)-dependent dehydrogenase (short-subunit alcohol dehydrogenase family)
MGGLFSDKVVIVTGAGGAIGRAAALAFAQEGANVVVSDITAQSAEATAHLVEQLGSNAIAVVGDVSKAEFAEHLVSQAVQKFGGLDSAFNNAGIVDEDDYLWDEAAFRRIIDTNLIGTMLGMKHQIPAMLARGGGTIVNTSSVQGLVAAGDPPIPAYTSSKHAIIGLTKTAALQYARQNIRANAVCPGVTRSAMVDKVMEAGEAVRQHLMNFAPLGRIGEPEDIANAVIWLCSSKASFVTGVALPVDGGFTAQ